MPAPISIWGMAHPHAQISPTPPSRGASRQARRRLSNRLAQVVDRSSALRIVMLRYQKINAGRGRVACETRSWLWGWRSSIASSANAEAPKRIGPDASPISASVSVPPGGRLVYISGTVPDAVDSNAPEGSVARFGDTEAQTRSVLRKVEAALDGAGPRPWRRRDDARLPGRATRASAWTSPE